MPLPHASLSLVHSAVHAKPKRAMILRMSAETLDALDAHPPIMFDFGSAPGIHIGDAFFPIRPQQESSPHELYLRAASAAKPNAPLKLYANIVGKFMVERQLGDKATDKVRQQTIAAKQQHLERQAILLDHPIPPAPKHAKRKTPAVPKKSPPQKVPPKANADVRRRLVHCLAISPRLADDAVRMVGGAAISSSARDDLLALLDDVAEEAPAKKGDKSPRLWALKPQSWTEVRPYEWPKLTENERTTMARQARMAFKALKIPESDPAWGNVRYRPAAPPPMAATTSTLPEAKRTATKDSKLKSKQGQKGDIQVKDEGTKATARANAIKRAEPDPAKTVPSRRVPGSGYHAKQSPQPVAEKPSTTHARKTIPAMPPKPMKKEDESDREYDRQRERERDKEKEKRRAERERVEVEKREKAKQKEREVTEREKRQKEKEREREEIEHEKRQREKARAPKERAAVPPFKRKQDTEETLDDAPSKPSPPKRRKLDDSSSSKATGSARPRRRSPIYTSSEDEGEIPQPRKRKPSPPPVSDRSNSSDQPQSEKAPRHHRATRTAYPTDHAALRALYQSQYTAYLGTFSMVVTQKRKIEAMLNGDSEGEMDVMDPDELAKLSAEHKTLRTELENILSIYTRSD